MDSVTVNILEKCYFLKKQFNILEDLLSTFCKWTRMDRGPTTGKLVIH